MATVSLSAKNVLKKDLLFKTQLNVIHENNDYKPKENVIQFLKKNDEETQKLVKNIISINFSDFKESIYKENIQFQSKINNTIKSYSKQLNSLSNYERILVEQFSNIKNKIEKIDIFSDKLTKFEDKLTILEIRLNNLLRDYHESVTKYDDLFLDNMSVPGKIGKFCKFKNIREFLSFAFDKINQFDLKTENFDVKLKNSREKVDKLLKKFACEMDLARDETQQVASKKFDLYEFKLNSEIKEINKKFELKDDFEKKINDLMENYNNIKNNLSNRLNNVENELQDVKAFKSLKNKSVTHKKESSNVSLLSLSVFPNNNNKDGKNTNPKKKTSKNMLKYHSFSINDYRLPKIKKKKNKKSSNEIKNEQSNLDYINEENDENNNISPFNNMIIKSINFSSYKNKENISENSIDNNENSSYKKNKKNSGIRRSGSIDSESLSSSSLNDSSYNEAKKENIENIIIDNKAKEEKDEKMKIKIGRSGTFGDIDLFIPNSSENKEKNFSNFLKRNYSLNNERNNNISTIKPKMKLEKIYENLNSNILNKTNIEFKNKSLENSKIKTKKSLKKSKKLSKSEFNKNNNKSNKKFNQISSIKIIKNNNNNKGNKIKDSNIKITNNDSNQNTSENKKQINNIIIFNNKTIKNCVNNFKKEQDSNNIITNNKSFENTNINNLERRSISKGNSPDNAFINNINFTSPGNSKKKELQMTKAYYKL